MWARCLGASFMWDEVVLQPYNLYSVCNAYVMSSTASNQRSSQHSPANKLEDI